jgi:hypothetical protein
MLYLLNNSMPAELDLKMIIRVITIELSMYMAGIRNRIDAFIIWKCVKTTPKRIRDSSN